MTETTSDTLFLLTGVNAIKRENDEGLKELWSGPIENMNCVLLEKSLLYDKTLTLENVAGHILVYNNIWDGHALRTGYTVGQQVRHTIRYWGDPTKPKPPTGLGYEILENGEVIGYVFPDVRCLSLHISKAQGIETFPALEIPDRVRASVAFHMLIKWF